MAYKGRYTVYWYTNVLTMIKRYPTLKEDGSLQEGIFLYAIEQALEETEQLHDGELRIRAIQMRYFNKTHSVEGVARELYVSEPTVKRWSGQFVRLVGKLAGY